MKKIIIMLLISVMVSVSMLGSRAYTVNAATDSEDHGFKIDEELYSVNWQETGKIMVPQPVKGKKKGMSQRLDIKVSNGYLMKNTKIELVSSVGSTAYTLSSVAGHGISMGSGVSTEDELSFDFSQNFSSDNSITVSYVQNSLNVTTNEDEKGYATWLYDYVSSNSSAEQNNYLFGSSVQ